MKAYLQHGEGDGPFRTEEVKTRQVTQVWFDWMWRVVQHIDLNNNGDVTPNAPVIYWQGQYIRVTLVEE